MKQNVMITAKIVAINIVDEFCGLVLRDVVATSENWLNNPYTNEDGLIEVCLPTHFFGCTEERALFLPGTYIEITMFRNGENNFKPTSVNRIRKRTLTDFVADADSQDREYQYTHR